MNVIFLLQHGSFAHVNAYFYHHLMMAHNTLALQAAVFVSLVGEVDYVTALGIVLSGWLFYQGRHAQASFIAIALVYVFGMCSLVKLAIHHPRPEHVRGFLSAYSFPSGHVALSTMLSVCLLHTGLIRKSSARIVAVVFCLCMIALSRIYLGAHWLADITGGWLLGMSSVYFSHIVWQFLPSVIRSGPLTKKHPTIPWILLGYVVIISLFMYWTHPNIQAYRLV